LAKNLGKTQENRSEKAREGKVTRKRTGDEDKKGNNKKTDVN